MRFRTILLLLLPMIIVFLVPYTYGFEQSLYRKEPSTIRTEPKQIVFYKELFLNKIVGNDDDDCGMTKDTACSSPRVGFGRLRDNITQTVASWMNTSSYDMYHFNVSVYLMSDFLSDPLNCLLPFTFPDEYEDLISIHLKLEGVDRQYIYSCSQIGPTKLLFATDMMYEASLYRVVLSNCRVCLNNVIDSVLQDTIFACIGMNEKIYIDDSVIGGVVIVSNMESLFVKNSVIYTHSFSAQGLKMLSLKNCTVLITIAENFMSIENSKTVILDMCRFEVISSRNALNFYAVEWLIVTNSEFYSLVPTSLEDSLAVIYGELVIRAEFTNCIYSDMPFQWIDLRNSFSVTITNITANRNTEGLILIYIENSSNVNITGVRMSNNFGRAIQLLEVKHALISNSSFSDNSNESDGGSLSVDAKHFRLEYSQFIKNSAGLSGGALIISDSTNVEVIGCTFMQNTARHSGGAIGIYMKNLLQDIVFVIQNSQFIGNSVPYNSTNTCNTLYDCTGAGGAVIGRNIFLGNVVFRENMATWGGALFFSSTTEETNMVGAFENNSASFTGGAMFVMESKNLNNLCSFHDNSAGGYGNDVASAVSNLSLVEFKLYRLDGSLDKYSVHNELKQGVPVEYFELSLGQEVEIYLDDLRDEYGNKVSDLREGFQIELPIILDDTSTFASIDKTRVNDQTIKFYLLEEDSIGTLTSNVIVSLLTFKFSIQLKVTPCPTGYEMGLNNKQQRVCIKTFPVMLVVCLSVLVFIVVMIIGIGIGLMTAQCAFRVIIKLKKLTQIERAEEEMEKRLLTSEFESYGSDPLSKNETSIQNDDVKLNYIIYFEDLQFDKKIGEGGFGSIYLAKCWGTTDVAVKTFRNNNFNYNKWDEEEFEKEVSLLVNLRNPFIVTFYGVCLTESKKFMVVEYMQKGSLEKLIHQSKSGREILSFSQKLQILIDVASGMKYLHGLKPAIVHRDLKPGNILINDQGKAKVCDFGISRILPMSTIVSSNTGWYGGTIFYMSPEVILAQEDIELGKTSLLPKIDVYSFSIIMWELFFEENPYMNNSSEKIHYFSKNTQDIKGFNIIIHVAKQNLRPVIPFNNRQQLELWVGKYMPNCTGHSTLNVIENYVDLMKECWSADPRKRPSFETILATLINLKNAH